MLYTKATHRFAITLLMEEIVKSSAVAVRIPTEQRVLLHGTFVKYDYYKKRSVKSQESSPTRLSQT